jgi:hypothetical protein
VKAKNEPNWSFGEFFNFNDSGAENWVCLCAFFDFFVGMIREGDGGGFLWRWRAAIGCGFMSWEYDGTGSALRFVNIRGSRLE